MNTSDELDRRLTALLRNGPTELPGPSFDAVRDRIDQTGQRVVIGPWRIADTMNKFVTLGLGAAAVVVALVIGTQLLGPAAPGGVGGAPSPAPSSTPEPSVTASPSAVGPSSTPAAGLPEGPFVINEAGDGLPSITATIAAPGWTFDPSFDALGKGVEVENLPEASILFWAYPAGTRFDVYGDPCQWKSTSPATPASTIGDFAAALAAQPSRDGSDPVDVTIGGRAGKSLTLRVPSDAVFEACDDENFTSYGVATEGGSEPSRWHQGPGQIDEFWILDVDGTTVVLDAMYRSDTSAELIDELRALAESTTFE